VRRRSVTPSSRLGEPGDDITRADQYPNRHIVEVGLPLGQVEVAEAGEVSEILIGAPGSLADTGSVADLVDQVRRRLEVSVEIIEPE